MITRPVPLRRLLGLSLLAALPAAAQQPPVTGHMLAAPTQAASTPAAPPAGSTLPHAALASAPAAPATAPDPLPATPVPAATAPRNRNAPGDATRNLLRLQASGSHAGAALPVLGDQAHRAHARYLKSFEHELPEFFDITVGQAPQGGGH